MHTSVRALLNQLIDYAGLFPPAKLPLEQALAEYLHLKKHSPHRWMLGRFVCPAARLAELLALAQGHEDRALLSLTVLGQQGADFSDFFAKLEFDIAAIQAFRSAWGDPDVIDTIEIPLPKAEDVERKWTWETLYGGYAGGTAHYLHFAAEQLSKADLLTFFEIPPRTERTPTPVWGIAPRREYQLIPDAHALQGYVDLPLDERWRDDVAKIAAGMTSVHAHVNEESMFGLKLRCGGVTAEAFPADEQVAFFIDQCWPAPLIWKATAGLHHPRRHWDASLNVWHHGFLNVFAAGLLAMACPLTQADLVAILADRDAEHFRFEEDRLAWKDWECTAEQIAAYRQTGPTAFGSCSFQEPCDDLTALGLLDTHQARG